MDECYEGLDGVVAIVDDILLYGHTRKEHDLNLKSVLARSHEAKRGQSQTSNLTIHLPTILCSNIFIVIRSIFPEKVRFTGSC